MFTNGISDGVWSSVNRRGGRVVGEVVVEDVGEYVVGDAGRVSMHRLQFVQAFFSTEAF